MLTRRFLYSSYACRVSALSTFNNFRSSGRRLSHYCYENTHKLVVEYTMSNQSLELKSILYESDRCKLRMFTIDVLIIGTLVVVGLIGNSLTFAVFWKGKFKTSTSFLFMCLSLSDSVVLLTAVPNILVSFVDYMGDMQRLWKYSYINLYVYPIHLATHVTTMWITVLIAINRYVIVCLPLRASDWCTDRKVKIQLAIVLLFAVLYISADIVMRIFTDNVLILIPVFHPTMAIILPICILTLLNIRLTIALRAHRRMQNQNQSSQKNDSMTFVLVIVVAVVIVCYVPRLVYLVVGMVKPYVSFHSCDNWFYLYSISSMLVVLNSAVNFIVYTILNKAFRDVLIQQVCKRSAPQQVPQQEPIAHAIADIEMAGAGATATPIASTGATVTPIVSTGATATPIASVGATVTPIASTGATATPIASVGATVTPIASTTTNTTTSSPTSTTTGGHRHEIADIEMAGAGANVTPIASTGATVTLIASTGATVTPIVSTDATVTPIARTDATVTPIVSTGATVTPIGSIARL